MTAVSWYRQLSEAEVARLLEVGSLALRRRVNNPHDLDDLKAELHVKILDQQDKIADADNREKYVCGMAKNLAKDHERRRGRRERESPWTEHESAPDRQAYKGWAEEVEDKIEEKIVEQTGPILKEYVGRSPQHRKKALVWVQRAYYRDTFPEIAADFGEPRWRVWRWFKEVNDHIRRELDRQPPPDGEVDDLPRGEG